MTREASDQIPVTAAPPMAPDMATPLAPLQRIPLGMAWAGSSVNCKTYAAEGLISAEGRSFGAFFDPAGALTVYCVAEDQGTVTTRKFARARQPHDAHDTPACNLDASGRLHVFSSAHVSRPTYLRSAPGADLATMEDCSEDLPVSLDKITYPSLVQAPGQKDLLLLYRAGMPGSSAWNILRCKPGRNWSRRPKTLVQGRLARNAAIGPYLNLPILFEDGRIGLAIVWRSNAVEGGHQNPLNRGIDYAEFAPDAATAHSVSGLGLPMPVTPLTAENTWPVGWGMDLTNQAGACLEAGSRPAFVSSWRLPGGTRQIGLIRQDPDSGWYCTPVATFNDGFRLLGKGTLATPQSRPVVVPVGDRALAVIYRNAENGGQLIAHLQPCGVKDPAAGRKLLLVEGGLDQYEPVAERFQSGRDGKLRMYVQRCAQRNTGDRPDQSQEAEAQLMIWDLLAAPDPVISALATPGIPNAEIPHQSP